MFVFLTILAIILLFFAGFISGLFYFAKNEPVKKQPFFMQNKKFYIGGKVVEYGLLAISLYLLVVTSGILMAAIYYLFMEYGLPKLLKPVYKKYFGIPSEAIQ